jgi:hypothetical protein
LRGARGRETRPAAAAWWIKCDPTAEAHGGWDWPDLFADFEPGVPYLWSVGTALSQKNARAAARGDPVLGYSAGEGHRCLRALAEVERGGVLVPGTRPPSPSSPLPGGFTVSLRPVALLERPVPLKDLREALARHDPEFFRTRFGSIFRVSGPELRAVLAQVKRANPRARVPTAWTRR